MAARGKHRFSQSVAVAFSIVAGVWLATLGLVVLAGAVPSVRKADAILVLGAAQYNGRPSPVLRARLDYSIALYQRGMAPRMVFTGGVGRGDTLSEGEVARRYAIAHGIPDDVIMVERAGLTSSQSMRAAAKLMRAAHVQRALIVSDRFHMLRLELLARRFGIRPYAAPTPLSRIDLSPLRWRYVLRESVIFPVAALVGGI